MTRLVITCHSERRRARGIPYERGQARTGFFAVFAHLHVSFRAPQSARNPVRAWPRTNGILRRLRASPRVIPSAAEREESRTSVATHERDSSPSSGISTCHSERRIARGIPYERGQARTGFFAVFAAQNDTSRGSLRRD